MSLQSHRVIFCLLSVVLLATGAAAHAAEQDLQSLTVEDVVRAWQQRGREIRSGRFTWSARVWLNKEWSEAALGYREMAKRNVSTEGRSFTELCSVVFDGSRVRFERTFPSWHENVREYREEHAEFTWNGRIGRLLQERDYYPKGQLWDFNFYSTQRHLRPLQYAFRMNYPAWYEFRSDRYVITDRRARVSDYPCLVIEYSAAYLREKVSRGRKPIKATFWVSPQQDYSVVRYTSSIRGVTTVEVNLKYKEDANHGWVPAEWRRTENWVNGLKPDEIEHATVTNYELNIPVKANLFELEFPEGTVVSDRRNQKRYIIRGGRKRPFTDEEFRRVVGNTPENSWQHWLLWGGGIVAVLCLVLGIKHRLSSRH